MPKCQQTPWKQHKDNLELLCKARKTVKSSLQKKKKNQMSYCCPKSQQEKLRSTSFYYIIYSLKFQTTEYCFFLKRGNRIKVSLLYKHITKRTGGLLNYQHLHLNVPLACVPPSDDQSSFSQGRKTWPRSPLALSPRNATVVVSALNTLSCLAPPRFS